MTETVRPGWAYKDGNTTTAYVDNRVELIGASTSLKIINDGANPLDFAINREEDTTEIDGVVKAGEELDLNDLRQGLSSIAVKGALVSAYRLWAYH